MTSYPVASSYYLLPERTNLALTDAPIFIVGVPRSGTTLLAAMLGAHSRISCGPETHFFRHLRKNRSGIERLGRARGGESEWPAAGVSFLRELHHTGRPVIRSYGLSIEEIEQFLRRREPGVPPLLEALLESQMRRAGKRRWAEKTPDHLLEVPTIRRTYPEAYVVRIIRDPRDVALSLVKVPWGEDNLLSAAERWRSYDRRGNQAFFERDERATTIRYEDLVRSPRETLRELCAFVDEEFEEAMLDTTRSAREVNRTEEPWKHKAAEPIDRSRIGAWEREMTGDDARLIESLVGDRIAALGYPMKHPFNRVAELYPNRDLGSHRATITRLSAEGVRFWRAERGERASLVVLLGNPDLDRWFGHKHWKRPVRVVRLAATLITSRTRGTDVRWAPDPGAQPSVSGFSRTAGRLLQLFGRRIS